VFQDNATSGEGAGYAMGLVMLGSKSDKTIKEMLAYAKETQHEKIIRSLAVGVAFVMYEQRDGADSVIEEMTSDQVSRV
jgi:26S proteasome regulatory subunit N2